MGPLLSPTMQQALFECEINATIEDKDLAHICSYLALSEANKIQEFIILK
jgi:hypothetical protein